MYRDIILGIICGLSFTHHAAALDVCEDCPDPRIFTSPGVGFDLTLNYGTAAVSFSNGTLISVAKVEGSPSYKYEMRRRLEGSLNLYGGLSERPPAPLKDNTKQNGVTQKFSHLLERILLHLHLVPTPPANPITEMLQVLKKSTEFFLSQEIRHVEIAVPLNPPFNHDNQTRVVDEMVRSLNLVSTNQRLTSASTAAGQLYALQHPEIHDHLEYILAVDYGRSGLMLTVDEVDMTVSEEKYRKWRGDLGSDAPSKKENYWQLVEDEIENSISINSERRMIDHIVLIGDHVLLEPQLLEILKKVLGGDTYYKVPYKSRRAGLEIDPMFGAAFAMARMSRENMFRSPEGCRYSGHCKQAENPRNEL